MHTSCMVSSCQGMDAGVPGKRTGCTLPVPSCMVSSCQGKDAGVPGKRTGCTHPVPGCMDGYQGKDAGVPGKRTGCTHPVPSCMVNGCQGMDAGVFFPVNEHALVLEVTHELVGWCRNYLSIPCMYCQLSLSDSEYMRGVAT